MTTSDLAGDLHEFLTNDLGPVSGDEPMEPPVDKAAANWLLRRLGHLVGDEAEIRTLAEAEMAKILAWREDRLSGIERQKERLAHALEGFARANGATTVNLPNGTLRLRAPRAHVEVTDEEAFCAWALAGGHLELVSLKAARRALAELAPVGDWHPEGDSEAVELATPEGEVVPGVTLRQATARSFSVSPS